jgi:LysM repeat protein
MAMNKRTVSAFLVAALLLVLAGSLTPAAAAPSEVASGSGCRQLYTVHLGETLFRIATRFGTSAGELARLNGLSNPNLIFAGMVLCVRGARQIPPPLGGFFYTVPRGDTLTRIARRFGWSARFLAKVNDLDNPNLVFAGQVLFIPFH